MKMTLNVFSALDQRPTTAIIQHSLKLSDTSVLPYKNGRASIKNVQKNLTNSSLRDKLRAILVRSIDERRSGLYLSPTNPSKDNVSISRADQSRREITSSLFHSFLQNSSIRTPLALSCSPSLHPSRLHPPPEVL